MGANSSPPASADVALDAVKSKKRKTSDAPLPIGLAAANATSPASADDPADVHTEATLERMATALDLGHSFLDRALLDPTLPKSTSLTMEDSRMRLQQLTAFVDALRAADVDGLALHLQRMFVADAGLLSTLREAADRALTNSRRPSPSSSAAASPTPVPSSSSNQHETDGDVNMDDEGHNDDPRASIHEEEAAQALTGLRTISSSSSSSAASSRPHTASTSTPSSTSTSTAIPNNTINVGHAAPPPPPHQLLHHPPLHLHPPQQQQQQQLPTLSISLPLPSPRTAVPYAHLAHHLPAMSPSAAAALYATAQSPYAGGPLFVSAPSPTTHVPSASPTAHTPGTLPSLFARGLLAPIASPYDTASNATSCTPMMSHLAPFVDWNSLPTPTHAPPPPPSSSSATDPAADASTPAYRSSPPLLAHGHAAQASPLKRKSILAVAKQLAGSPSSSASPAVPSPTTSSTDPSSSSSSAAAAALTLPIAKSLAALERAHPTRKANPRRWTKDEDDALRTAVENHKEKNWKAIAAQVPGRNHTQCLQRWTKVLAPGLVKGHWSPHEDELLRRLVAGGNKNWGEVAAKIPGRTSKQCRERWHNHLDPNIVRGAYTPEEDRIILEAQARLGNRWSVIAAMLPGRTEDAVKIRWKSHCRLWKARKYLRKTGSSTTPANANGTTTTGDDDHGELDEDPDEDPDDEADDQDDEDPDDDDQDDQDDEHRPTAVHDLSASSSATASA